MELISYLLWGLLFLGTVGQVAYSWFKKKSSFDFFEAKHIFLLVFFIYYGIPSFYYLLSNPAFPGVKDTASSLQWVLLYSLLGLGGFYVGYQISIVKKFDFLPTKWEFPKLKLTIAAFSIVAVLAGSFLASQVGGFCYYLTHLGQTNVLLVGKIYFVWGLILLKLAALFILTYYLSNGPKGKFWKLIVGGYLVASAVVVLMLGARLLAAVYLVEVLVIYHYLLRKIGLKFLALAGVFTVIFIIGLVGEYRNFTWSAPQICSVSQSSVKVPENLRQGLVFTSNANSEALKSVSSSSASPIQYFGESFANQISTTSSDWRAVVERYINNYFDSVLTTMVVIDNTPQNLSYQYGRSYLALLVQPIPYAWRPNIFLSSRDNPEILTGGTGYARILSLLGEAYLNFSILGIILVPLILGMLSKAAYDLLLSNRTNLSTVLIYAIFIGGLMMIIRGYFVGAGSFFLMDLVPVLLVLWWFKKSAKAR